MFFLLFKPWRDYADDDDAGAGAGGGSDEDVPVSMYFLSFTPFASPIIPFRLWLPRTSKWTPAVLLMSHDHVGHPKVSRIHLSIGDNSLRAHTTPTGPLLPETRGTWV